MTKSTITKCLKLLELNRILAKVSTKYIRTLNVYEYSKFKVEEVLETRYRELNFMINILIQMNAI